MRSIRPEAHLAGVLGGLLRRLRDASRVPRAPGLGLLAVVLRVRLLTPQAPRRVSRLGGAILNAARLFCFQWRCFGTRSLPGPQDGRDAATSRADLSAGDLRSSAMPSPGGLRELSSDSTFGFFGTARTCGSACSPSRALISSASGPGGRERRGAPRQSPWCGSWPCSSMWRTVSAALHWRGGWTIGPRYFGAAPPFFAFGAVGALNGSPAVAPRHAASCVGSPVGWRGERPHHRLREHPLQLPPTGARAPAEGLRDPALPRGVRRARRDGVGRLDVADVLVHRGRGAHRRPHHGRRRPRQAPSRAVRAPGRHRRRRVRARAAPPALAREERRPPEPARAPVLRGPAGARGGGPHLHPAHPSRAGGRPATLPLVSHRGPGRVGRADDGSADGRRARTGPADGVPATRRCSSRRSPQAPPRLV